MSRAEPKQEAVPRSQAIDMLRQELLKLVDEENSICKVAAERHIFCHGFQRYGDGELRRRFAWLDRRFPGMTRTQLEQVGNLWQLARQEVDQLPLACDVQQKEHDTCRGWDDFSNEELSRYYFEVTGRNIIVA